MVDVYPTWPKVPPWRISLGISLEMPNGFFGHVGIFSEEISETFGVGLAFEFIEQPHELARFIATAFNEFEIEFREEDYDHLLAVINREMGLLKEETSNQ